MRAIAAALLGIALIGCTASDGTPIILDGTMIGTARELANPGSTYKNIQAHEDATCQKLGFKPGTEAYGNCRLQLYNTRVTREAADTVAASNRNRN